MSTFRLPFWIAGAVLVLLVAAPTLVTFYVNWLWFGEIGYQQVYSTVIRGQATMFLVTMLAAFAWLAGHFTLALGKQRDIRPVFRMQNGVELSLPGVEQLRKLVQLAALGLAIAVGLFASGQWETWLAWQHGQPFNTADPILGYDVAFYVFSLPFFRLVLGLCQFLIVVAALGCGGLYFITGHLGSSLKLAMSTAARQHLYLLVAAFFLTSAISAYLGRTEYLLQPSTHIYGPAYTDVHAGMPVALLLTGVALLGAILTGVQALTRRNWPLPVAVGLYLAVAFGGQIYGSLLQRIMVSPNEQARETPFIQHNIDATRRAFGIDTVVERQVSGDARLTREDIERNASTLENVRLWDHQPLLDTFGQLQVIRTYYDFVTVDNDRYHINGSLRQVMLSARELNLSALPNRTWISEHLTYTHGYGLTLGPVNQVTSEGLPVLFVRDLPPETSAPELKVDEPSIYFGELSNDYVIVRTKHPEFHYPRGDDNVETTYAGRGGVEIGPWWRKLLFAFHFRAYQIFLSDDIGPESRVMFNRNIRDRVTTLAPFLTFDQDPYLVLADGRLFWIYDAYTTTGQYPYSTRYGRGVNYMRNSVKFVIDAYHGSTTAYLADPADPIAATYASIFPTLFRPLSEMPATLRQHVRYPEDIFGVQAAMYATYHMTQPSVYFNREDQWDIPAIGQERQEVTRMQPYYTIMRLPGETEPEFIQMLPFSPRNRENLAAWLVARSDGSQYGKLQVFEFPKQKTVYGPRQVVARISQDQTISPQITLWNQQGSQVDWGTLMVIPIGESLIYVRPLYLRASGGRIPELSRVAVAYQDEIVMERTLEEGLMRIFGGRKPAAPVQETTQNVEPTAPPSGPASSPAMAQLAAEARGHYDRAVQAQRSGDWAKYGEELKRLGELLTKMK
jgi:uncharacterized protein